jgi:hypothetical protein
MPMLLVERAKLKGRPMTLLHESPDGDARGIVNIAPEKEIKEIEIEIRKLANKLSSDTGNLPPIR